MCNLCFRTLRTLGLICMERQSGLFLLLFFRLGTFSSLNACFFSGCVIFHLLLRIFICFCLIYVFFVQFLFVAATFFLSLLVFSLSMLRIIHLVPYFIRGGVLRSACFTLKGLMNFADFSVKSQ